MSSGEREKRPVRSYLVERYAPGVSVEQFQDLALRATAGADGMPGVRHLLSLLLGLEETAFCLYAAPDERAVAEANERAGLAFDRITEVVLAMASPGGIGAATGAPSVATPGRPPVSGEAGKAPARKDDAVRGMLGEVVAE